MHKLITWFQLNYPELRDELKNSMHNFDDTELNPFHLESDCWSHTMMVCKIAQIEDYDKVVQIASLLHDIGKPRARKINPRNNHVQFFGHEVVSAYLSIDILKKMFIEKMIDEDEFVEIFLLIALHSTFHKEKNILTLFNKFRNHKSLFIHLTQLSKCDSLGRFCDNNAYNYKKENVLQGLSKEMSDKKMPNKVLNLLKKETTINEIDSVISELFK